VGCGIELEFEKDMKNKVLRIMTLAGCYFAAKQLAFLTISIRNL
jgi:hypothetical protein